MPPTPRATSKAREPVEMAMMSLTLPSAPSFMIEPLPNSFSIWEMAVLMARSLSGVGALLMSFLPVVPPGPSLRGIAPERCKPPRSV
jgi:hypothetical protein